METVFFIIIFLYSVIAHEVAHGKMADYLGDPTARYAGRLTLNPLPHIDPIGSVFLPFLLILTQSPILFGWAKPVPYNPYNLKNQRYGSSLVAGAGVGTNFFIALALGLSLRFIPLPMEFSRVLGEIVFINIVLGVFNLVPIPPLDGSKILFDFLPLGETKNFLEQYGFFVLILFMFFGFQYLYPLINTLFRIITGA